MNRFNHFNSQLDAFTLYHLEAEESKPQTVGELSDQANAVVAGFSGAIGTSIANIAVYPLDLVVKRLQVQRQIMRNLEAKKEAATSTKEQSEAEEKHEDFQLNMYKGVSDAVRRIYAEEGGIKAFYSGCLGDTANSMVTAFLYFLSYNFVRERRLQAHTINGKTPKNLGVIEELAVGAVAGCFAKFCTSPVSNIVTRKQTAFISAKKLPSSSGSLKVEAAEVPSMTQLFHDIYKEHGIHGFWSGYKATVFLTLNPSITFCLYEMFKALLPRRFREQQTAGQTFVMAAVAKSVASSIMYPFSVAKSRSQVRSADHVSRYEGVLGAIREIYEDDGFLSLYEGIGGEILKGFHSHGITMLIKEYIHQTMLSSYFAVMRARQRSETNSLSEAVSTTAQKVYEKNTTESQRAAVDKVVSASQDQLANVKDGIQKVSSGIGSVAKDAGASVSGELDAREIRNMADSGKEVLEQRMVDARRELIKMLEVDERHMGDVSGEVGGIEWEDDKDDGW